MLAADRQSLPVGDTPLHIAAERGLDRVVRALVAGGASVDERNNAGQTALMIAETYADDKVDCTKVIEILREHAEPPIPGLD